MCGRNEAVGCVLSMRTARARVRGRNDRCTCTAKRRMSASETPMKAFDFMNSYRLKESSSKTMHKCDRKMKCSCIRTVFVSSCGSCSRTCVSTLTSMSACLWKRACRPSTDARTVKGSRGE
jgi:hypothetical protein